MQELSQMRYQYRMVYPRELYWDCLLLFFFNLLMIYLIMYQNVKLVSMQMTQLLYVLVKLLSKFKYHYNTT